MQNIPEYFDSKIMHTQLRLKILSKITEIYDQIYFIFLERFQICSTFLVKNLLHWKSVSKFAHKFD